MDSDRKRLPDAYKAHTGATPHTTPTPANLGLLEKGFRQFRAFYKDAPLPEPVPSKHSTSVHHNASINRQDNRGVQQHSLFLPSAHFQQSPRYPAHGVHLQAQTPFVSHTYVPIGSDVC